MGNAPDLVERVAMAESWDARVALVRRIPEEHGLASQSGVYADIAERVYAPHVSADVGYVHWRDDYEMEPLDKAYSLSALRTNDFHAVTAEQLRSVILEEPTTLRVFRLMLGLTTAEFAEATAMVSIASLRKGTVNSIEAGRRPSLPQASACATVIDQMMTGELFPPGVPPLRSKIQKPDTIEG